VYVPGETTIVSPGAAALTAFWIAAVLPVAGTVIVFACAAAARIEHAKPASRIASSLIVPL
jgi:hypothetical protein